MSKTQEDIKTEITNVEEAIAGLEWDRDMLQAEIDELNGTLFDLEDLLVDEEELDFGSGN